MQVFASAVLHITTRLKAVVARRAGVALALCGEAGIGKTYAAQSILGELTCHSFTLHSTLPLPSILCALPRPAKLPLWAAHSLERLARGEILETSSTADALGALLGALAPVVLHLEDLHEAPAERAGLVVALAERAKRHRGVALLITSRQEPPRPFEAFCLEPLSRAASDGLLEDEVGVPLSPEACAWIYAKAAGNPLYTLEFCRYLARAGFLWNDGGHWHWRNPPKDFLPPTVEALIEQLVMAAKSSEVNRFVLETRALLPAEASFDLWQKIARVSPAELQMAIRNLVQQGVFTRRSFAHPLFKEVTLKTLTPERRQHLSRRAVGALEDDPEQAALFVEDSALDDEQALGLFKAAAERSKDSVLAARLLAQAANHAQGEERGRLAQRAAEVLQYHNLSEAVRLLALALNTSAASAETVRLYAQLLVQQGRMPEVEALLEGLSPHLSEQLQPTALFVIMHNSAGDHHAALATWEAHPELHSRSSPDLLRAVAASALATGRIKEAQMFTVQGLEAAFEGEGRSEFLSLQSLIFFHQGNYAAAEATNREALTLLAGMNVPRLRSTALLNRAAFLRMLGDYAAMGECLEESLQLRQEVGDGKAYAFAQAALAELRLEQGRYEQAEDLLSEAVATLELYGPSRFLINAHSMASVLYTAQATPLGKLLALKHSERALLYARQLGNSRAIREILFDASVANTCVGNTQRSLSLAEEAQTLAEAAGNSPNDNFRTLWALALAKEALGAPEQATLHLREALSLAWAAGIAIDAQKIGLELDRLTNDLESARSRLSWFEAQGLLNGANLARRYFPALAQPKPAPIARELVRLELLGPSQISTEATSPLRGRKRQELLALLLEARVSGRSDVPKLALLDALYPGDDELKSGSSLKEIVHSLRDALGANVILTTPGGYALGECTSDVEQFLTSLDTSLWRGLYLEGLELEESPVRESLYLALHRAAQDLLESDPKEAARVGKLLLEAEPYSVTYLRTYLCALRSLDNHRSLERQYQAARERLLEVGETLPPRWQDFLVIL